MSKANVTQKNAKIRSEDKLRKLNTTKKMAFFGGNTFVENHTFNKINEISKRFSLLTFYIMFDTLFIYKFQTEICKAKTESISKNSQ